MTNPPAETSSAHHFRFDPACLILAWIWPGLGHLRLGHKRRGALIMSGVLGMFLFGVLVGGVDVVDRELDSLWFLPQALAGPITFLTDYLNVTFVKSGRIGMPSIGRVNEIGTLYTALAGLMNLAVMIDAATRDPQSRMGDDRDVPKRRRAEDQERSSAVDRPSPDSLPSGGHTGHASATNEERRTTDQSEIVNRQSSINSSLRGEEPT